MNRMKWMVLAATAALLVGGCSPGKKYERRLKHELASGVRYDSLFIDQYSELLRDPKNTNPDMPQVWHKLQKAKVALRFQDLR